MLLLLVFVLCTPLVAVLLQLSSPIWTNFQDENLNIGHQVMVDCLGFCPVKKRNRM